MDFFVNKLPSSKVALVVVKTVALARYLLFATTVHTLIDYI